MKKSILIAYLFLSGLLVSAQIKFQHLYGGPAYDDAQDILQTGDGGFMLCGTTESFGAGQSDIWVVKTDNAGLVQWSKAYGSSGLEYGAAIKKDPSGGFIIAGTTFGLSADTLTDDFLLVKINSSGNVLWSKTYGGPANDEAHALTVMPDSGFAIAGTTASFGTAASQSGYVVRTDKNGTLLWSKAISQNSDQQLFAIEATDDGGCIVAGYTYVSTLQLFDILLAKLNANGSKQWVHRYGGSNSEQAYAITKASTGGYVVSGYTSSFGTGQEDACILRVDDGGDFLWFNTYGTAESERARSIYWKPTEGLFISGQAKVNSPSGYVDHNFLLRADTDGVVNWAKTFGPTLNISLSYAATRCSDGGYAMAGLTGGFGAQLNDVYLVKTNDAGGSGCNQTNAQLFSSLFTPTDSADGSFSNGGVENTVAAIRTNTQAGVIIQCNSTGVGLDEKETVSDLILAPNPSAGQIRLQDEQGFRPGDLITITDPLGKIVQVETISSSCNQVQFSADQLAGGCYMIRVNQPNTTRCKKLLIRK